MLKIHRFPLAIEELRCNGPQAMALDVLNEDYDPSAIEAFSEVLKNNSTLTYLESSLKIDDRGAATLAKAFEENNVLTCLDLYIKFPNNNDADNTNCINVITAALEKNKALTTLKFRSAPSPTDAIVKAFAAMLKKNTTLTSFHFSHPNVSDDLLTEGHKAIAKALEKNSTLTTIEIANRYISDDSIQAFAAMLEKNTTLTSFIISAGHIHSNTDSIAKALEKNSTLTTIKIETRDISDDSIQAFAAMLEKNTTLTSFHLKTFTDKGFKIIAKVLKKNTTLTLFSLTSYSYHYSNEGIIAVMEALEENNSLISIAFLSGESINNQCAQAIAKMLEKNSTLASISLDTGKNCGTKITPQVLSEIAKAFEKNTTLLSIDPYFINSSPQIEAAINRNKKISTLAHPVLESLQNILFINECPDTEEKFNEIATRYLNIEEALNEIKQLYPTATQLDQIQTMHIQIAAKHPWLIEPGTAFDLFEELNEKQKISDKNQASLEIIALNYYGEIHNNIDYNHLKLLGFILKNLDKNNNEQIKHLLNQCLYKCINGKEIQTASLAIEPALILETLAINNDKTLSLLQEIPGVDKMIDALVADIKEPDATQCKVKEMLAASLAIRDQKIYKAKFQSLLQQIPEASLVMQQKIHKAKLQSLLQQIPEASLVIKQQKNQKSKELKQSFDLISKIEEYSKILDKKSSQTAKNKASALMAIVHTYQHYREAKEPLTKTLGAVRSVVVQNKEIIRQHRHWFGFNCFFPLFQSTLENRVTSYKLVKNLEKHIEKIQAENSFTTYAAVKT